MELKFRNVNHALRGLVKVFTGNASDVPGTYGVPVVKRQSRNGPVLVIDEPVLLTYTNPTERVLFNAARDANPFFHLYEALWMLAGRNDVSSLAYYNSNIAQFSDDGKTFNGAYGYRWRHGMYHRFDEGYTHPETGVYLMGQFTPLKNMNQLDLLVEHLKANPDSRRAVLQMWNVEDDLLKLDHGKDLCCNLSVMFSMRTNEVPPDTQTITYPKLDMTVTNRSNDLTWGLLGANYVHFSMLQEYMAARLGAQVGRYSHFTNNLHVYTELHPWEPEKYLAYYGSEEEVEYVPACTLVPLVKDPAVFEVELQQFVDTFPGKQYVSMFDHRDLTEPFLCGVAFPALMAYRAYKERGKLQDWYGTARSYAGRIEADDWRVACVEWLHRRRAKSNNRYDLEREQYHGGQEGVV